ncbi:MAG: Endonuclease, Uma2 family (restriction endonuclease fold) [Verrucomicrobia bacterium]|jgi:Uma2 family endonuclease|nr:MAG: Endonuclease, Uma2 family (restriction endonuclease fold) [Verrucomicrobiota bacterium]
MSAAEQPKLFSVEEYLRDEEMRGSRHEYLGGTIHAMAGGNRRHNEIISSIFALLRPQLREGTCKAYIETVKLHIKTSLSEFFYYPDVMVGCDPADSHDYFLEKPSILFEVLSPSTESIDRREKLLAYQTIPSLGHYVIVAQEERRIEWLQREGNSWKVSALTQPEDRLEFPAQGASLTLAEIYEGIAFG